MKSLYLKGNVRYLETLYTDYKVVSPLYFGFFRKLQNVRELVANSLPRRLMHSAAGMAEQKYAAMDHPFPSKLEVLEEHGYDPKQLHHLVRLENFMRTFMESLSYEASLVPDDSSRAFILSLKTKPLPKQQAWELADITRANVKTMLECADRTLPEDNNHALAQEALDDLVVDLFKFRYKISEEEK